MRAVAAGETTCEAVVRDCLARIEAREGEIHAWASIDPELALRQARALDRATMRGPLHGVPIGVKDIIDTADQPTEMGSPIYRGHRPTTDAACVALTRAAGAVMLGKTVTCEFAGMTPGITTNPHNTAHTPGGSSSGSGAAVADCMVPVAFGTQTGGSVLRPAAYCGVFGFKPSFGAFNRRGVYPAAESLDTIGLIARSLDDIELLSAVLELRPPVRARDHSIVRRASGYAARRCGTRHSRRPWRPSRMRRRGSARPARRCGRSCCRSNSRACATPRARPSTITSAPPRWRTSGTAIARRSASGCASASRSGARCHMPNISRPCDSARTAARGSRKCSTASTCCWRLPPTAKRRAGSATPAIRASRRSGPSSIRRR